MKLAALEVRLAQACLYFTKGTVHKGCHHFFLTPSSPMSSTSYSQFSDPHKKDVTISKFPLCNNQTGGESPKIDKQVKVGTPVNNKTNSKIIPDLMLKVDLIETKVQNVGRKQRNFLPK